MHIRNFVSEWIGMNVFFFELLIRGGRYDRIGWLGWEQVRSALRNKIAVFTVFTVCPVMCFCFALLCLPVMQTAAGGPPPSPLKPSGFWTCHLHLHLERACHCSCYGTIDDWKCCRRRTGRWRRRRNMWPDS